jgi:hypothetical protein
LGGQNEPTFTFIPFFGEAFEEAIFHQRHVEFGGLETLI